MADSGTSNCFTHTQSNLSEFEVLDDNELVVKTANKTNSLKIRGKGAWIITHEVTHRGKKWTVTSCLYPVYYLPGLTHRFLSVSHMLNNGFELKGSVTNLNYYYFSSLLVVTCFFLFLYLLNMQENTSCQTHVQHVFASWQTHCRHMFTSSPTWVLLMFIM
jgi:hypothetical protein